MLFLTNLVVLFLDVGIHSDHSRGACGSFSIYDFQVHECLLLLCFFLDGLFDLFRMNSVVCKLS